MFGSVDGIKKKKKYLKIESQVLSIKKPSKVNTRPFYYLYKTFQVIITFWIVLIIAIVFSPWLNYFIKNKIIKGGNQSNQVLGQNTESTTQEKNPAPKGQFLIETANVRISAPFVEGIEEDSLKQGLGHHPDSVWPNEKGNAILAGHSFDLDVENTFGKVFFELKKVDIGDKVTIFYEGKEYIYEVNKKETVSAGDKSLFEKADDWILTFYTCDPPYTDWKRLVVQAKLIKIE